MARALCLLWAYPQILLNLLVFTKMTLPLFSKLQPLLESWDVALHKYFLVLIIALDSWSFIQFRFCQVRIMFTNIAAA